MDYDNNPESVCRQCVCLLKRVRELEHMQVEYRDDLLKMRQELSRKNTALESERAAHEQTRAELKQVKAQYAEKHFWWVERGDELDKLRAEHGHTQARRAELERELEECQSLKTWHHGDCESALASARELLERAQDMLDWDGVENDLREDIDRWRSVHPTPGAEKGAGT